MKADIKRRWVEALRSGEYEQGNLRLRDDGAHCCLGVLCDVHDPTGWVEGGARDGFSYRYGTVTDPIGLPDPLREAIGMNSHYEGIVISMNDSGSTFAEIADWIEAHIEVRS